ncbi:NADPH:quinone reductase [Pseudonocardia sp. ICBG1034]|uniref:NADPH:quinone reductase n=1 Tax=Pseudonocardia sp. ICBG1034 TaxID=2844381 RepID=UPI001CD03FD2|nr:NADPH:quinone reductase [Pseudonocardia sp. ICBG1034]MBO4240102.1 zinc-binding dehydrogenase [Pseudonocardia alni]
MAGVKAAGYSREGTARDVLTVGEIDTPEPGPGQVRVRVRISAVNPTDTKTRDGTTSRPFDGVRVPHQDGVGEIDAVGEGVDPSRVGQRVWTWLASPGGAGGAALAEWGTCAQYTVLPAEQATVLPDGAPDDLGACLGVPAMTAYHCLFADGPVAGRTVLVTGGAGAVGHYGIQLARWAGATVVTTVSGPEKAELARAAGAHHVVNYRDGDPGAAILDAAGPVDRIVEVSLAQNLAQDLAVLRNGGAVVSYAATPQDPSIPVRALMGANAVLRFALLYTVPRPVLADAAHGLGVAAAHGALTPLPVTRFGIDDVVAAHEAVEAGTTGKVVVDL